MVMIAPSILSADFGNLEQEIKKLDKSGADLIHMDIMDGHFVPNLTFGPAIVKHLRSFTNIPFDTHLMVSNPEVMIPWFAEADSDIITIHYEAVKDLHKSLADIKKSWCKAGVSIKPKTKFDVLKPYLDKIDLILVMSVEPGFGGQSFIESQLDKIRNLKKLIGKREILIEVDGGINEKTAPEAIKAGADILVAGTAVFKDKNYKKNIESLR